MSSMIHSYPSIHTFGHKLLGKLFDSEVYIEEKLDGSQISFMKDSNGYHVRSKNKQIDINKPDSMFGMAIEQILTLNLCNDWIYRGEYLRVPHHNVLNYSRTPNKNIIIFDIERGNQDFLSYEEKKYEANRIGLEVAPLLAQFILTISREELYNELIKLFDTESILGGVNIEGVVIKNYKSFGEDDKVLMGKLVSEKFKEKHKIESKTGFSNIVEKIGKEYGTEARWEKAIQHLRDNGELEDSPKDIGILIKEIQDDVIKECREEITQELFSYFCRDIRNKLIAGFPEWYKKKLIVGDNVNGNI